MGPLPPEAEGVEQLVVDALHNLAYCGHPASQALGPASLARVSFGRMDDGCSVALLPAAVVLGSLKALVSYVGSPADRSHADEPLVWLSPHGEEGFRQMLVGGRSTSEAEARDDPSRVDGGQQAKAFVPSQTITPTDVSLPGHPSMPSTLAVPGRHSRAVQRFVRALWRLQQSRQMQDESLDEFCVQTHAAVELRAVGQSRKSRAQLGLGVAVEIPLAGEPGPPGEDSQGDHLASTERRLWSWSHFRRAGVAEVVDHNVECGEEGVHIEHEESVPFPSESGGKPTLECGHLPLKSSSYNSHQAFKEHRLQQSSTLSSAATGNPTPFGKTRIYSVSAGRPLRCPLRRICRKPNERN